MSYFFKKLLTKSGVQSMQPTAEADKYLWINVILAQFVGKCF